MKTLATCWLTMLALVMEAPWGLAAEEAPQAPRPGFDAVGKDSPHLPEAARTLNKLGILYHEK